MTRWRGLESAAAIGRSAALLADKACSESKVRRTVAPPKKDRKEPSRFYQEDKEAYKQRNEMAFLRLKEFRRIFTR
jgi:hypothetical protein